MKWTPVVVLEPICHPEPRCAAGQTLCGTCGHLCWMGTVSSTVLARRSFWPMCSHCATAVDLMRDPDPQILECRRARVFN